MKTVPLTANEIDKIKELYSQELDRLHKRAAEISSMLKRLQRKSDGVAEEKIDKVDKTAKAEKVVKKAGRPGRKKIPKEKETPASSKIVEKKAKRGRPAKNPLAKASAKAVTKPEPRGRKKRTAEKPTKAQKVSKVVQTKAKKGRPAKVKRGRPAKAKVAKPAKTQKVEKAKSTTKVTKVAKTKGKTAKAVAKVKPTPVVKKGKPGRKKSESSKKSRWTTTIIELLEATNKLLSSRVIVDEVMKRQNIPAADYSKTRSIVAGSLSDLVLETKRLKTIPIPGQKGKLYGLSQWFDEKGNVADKSKLS